MKNISQYENTLNGKIVLLTGAGGGIGLRAAENFAAMGAKVIIPEADEKKGNDAEKRIQSVFPDRAEFYRIDLADENSIWKMKDYVLNKYGCPDVVFNNAAVLHLGDVGTVSGSEWDNGYYVNLKAPVLLVNCFLGEMKRRNSGVFVFVSSSGAAAHMGAYEIFKTAQAELSSTLSMELEGTNIFSYTISPGLVKTDTAKKSIEEVAESMNISLDEFYEMNRDYIVSVEDAALGFALSVLHAEEYNGQEIGAIQVINGLDNESGPYGKCSAEGLKRVAETFEEQYLGWQKRSIFEKQWVLRDFKKSVGMSADEAYQRMKSMEAGDCVLSAGDSRLLKALIVYWEHQYQLLQGFEKNKEKLRENSHIIKGWISDIECLLNGENQ